MSLFTDTDLNRILIKERGLPINQENLFISPFSEESLTPVGYDLRVGDTYASQLTGKSFTIGEDDSITVKSGETVLIQTLEKVEMPLNHSLSGLISSKVSIVSKGIAHISTTIDADWKGKFLIALTNVSKENFKLKFGQPFCTAVFLTNNNPSTKMSDHPEGRNDELLKLWIKRSRKAIYRERWRLTIILSLLPLFTLLAWLLFGNAPGMTAMVSAAVVIIMILKEKFIN